MGDPMRIRAKAKDGVVDVRVLMAHPMETGFRKDSSGKTIPAHFIKDVKATSNGKTVLAAQWSQAVSQNPYLQFKFKGANPGDKVTMSWVDNKGDSRTDEAVIA